MMFECYDAFILYVLSLLSCRFCMTYFTQKEANTFFRNNLADIKNKKDYNFSFIAYYQGNTHQTIVIHAFVE